MSVGRAAAGSSSAMRRIFAWIRKKKRRRYATYGAAAGATVGGVSGWKSRKRVQKFGGNIVLPDYDRRRY